MAENDLPQYYIDEKSIEGSVRNLCLAMAERHNNPGYADRVMIEGLSNFLKVIVEIKMRSLNQRSI